MSFIKRAVLYCRRQWSKTAILFLILTILAALILTGIAVRNASAAAAADVRAAVGGKIFLEPETEGHMGSEQQNQWGTVYEYNGDLITPEIVKAIREVDGVVACNSEDRAAYYGAGVDFHYLPAAFGLSYTPYGESSSYTATISSEKCSDFQSGKYRLVEGRHITGDDKNVCLLSKELAEYNKLSVGDTINMYSLDADAVTAFEIVGIFDGTEGTAGNALTVDEIPANCGYIDYETMFELFGEELNGYQQLTIYGEDPVNIQTVYDSIAALPQLKGKTLKLQVDTEEYDVVAAPLASLQKLMNTAIVLISLVSIGILTLLLTIWIRGRKKEIGILLSLGKSRINLAAQFFAEIWIVAAAAFASSVPLSSLTAEKAGELLASKTAVSSANLSISVSLEYLLPLYLIGTLIVTISVAASSWTVVRLQPKDILTKMS